MGKILEAAERIRETHPKMLLGCEKRLKALILLMRYSGLRISDAVGLKRETIGSGGRLFLYQAKTGHPVVVPVPDFVMKALKDCDEGNEYYFWTGMGKLKSGLTEWQDRLKKVFTMAGIPDGHGHRLRDSFAVSLLERRFRSKRCQCFWGTKIYIRRGCTTLPGCSHDRSRSKSRSRRRGSSAVLEPFNRLVQ